MMTRQSARLSAKLRGASWLRMFLTLMIVLGFIPLSAPSAVQALVAADVEIRMVTDPLLVSDSNGCSSGDGPQATYVGFRVRNTSGATLTNLTVSLGDFDTGFGLAGGQAASQYIGLLTAGESDTVYWYLFYPCHTAADTIDTLTVTVSDGVTAPYAYSDSSAPLTTTTDNVTTTIQSLSTISANAGGLYQGASLGAGAVVGQIIPYTVTYEFGGVGVGDRYNLQPSGETSFNAGCLQLINSEITASSVNAIPVNTRDDLFYYATATQPGSGHSVTVRYYFIYLCDGVSTSALPYASQTSGSTNIKYAESGYTSANQITFPSASPASATFQVTKVASASTLPAGGLVTYTVQITNTSGFTSSINRLTDILPPGVTYGSLLTGVGQTSAEIVNLSSSQPAAGATGTIVWNGGRPSTFPYESYVIPGGSSLRLMYTANIPNIAGSYTNAASASSGTETTNTASATVIAGNADLSIAKTDSPDPVAVGNNLTYSIVVTNNGPAAAGATVTDALPTSVTFQSLVAPAGWSCTTPAVGSTGTVSCNIASLANGASATFTVVVRPGPAAAGTLANTATVSGTLPDLTPGNNTSTASTTVTAQADLAISKSGPGSLVAGTNAIYTIVVTNNGPSDAANVSVTDPTPAGLTFVSNTGSCTTVFPCSLGTIPAGQTRTIQTTFAVPPSYSGATVANTATVSSSTADPTAANNTSTATSPSGTQADLAIAKTGPASVVAGTNAVYTIVVTNNGPSDAANVTVADPTPAELSFVSNTGDCTTAFPCNLGTIPAGQTRTIQATFSVPSSYSGTTVANTATVSSTTADPTAGNGTSTVNTPVTAQADLGIAKTGPASVVAGTNAVYTIVVTNNGPSDAANVSVADPTPSGLTFVSNSGDCATAFPCSLGTVPVGQTRTIQATFTIPANYSGAPVANTATVSSTTTDPTAANNSSVASTSVTTQADLAISKSGPPSLIAGTNAVYTIVVTNNGPSDAANVSVADLTPAGLTFVSNTGDCTAAFPCSLGSIPAGQTRTIQATFSVPSGYSGATVANTATVSSATTDPNSANNSSTATSPSGVQADLAIAKSGPASLAPGMNAVYTILVTNNGPSDAANVTVADPTPAGLTFVSNTGDCTAAFPCNLGTIPAGQTRTIQATFAVPTGYSAATVDNTATLSSTTPDSTGANNTSTVNTPVAAQADLAIAKSGPASLAPGTSAVYTIVVTNDGPSDAANVSVADPTPAGLTFVSNTGDCTAAFPCNLGTIPAGETRTIQTTFSVPSSYSGTTIGNTATVSSPTADPSSANNTSIANTTVAPQADLAIVKSGPTSIVAGTNPVYTIVVTNSGPSDAVNVTVTDPTPAGLTFVSNSGDCATAFPCDLGTIPAGQTRTIQTTFSVPADYSGATVDNAATVSSPTGDPNSANNTSTATSPSGAQADLAIAKSGPPSVVAGTNAVYTIVVTNNGPSDAANVSVADPAPSGLTFVSNAGDCATAFPCNLGTIPAGQTRTIQTTFSVPSGYSGTTVANTATVSSSTADPSSANNTSTTSTPAGQQADLAIAKSGSASLIPGTNAIYMIVVTNNGPSDAANVSVADLTPAGLTFVSNSGDCATAFPCDLGTIPAGQARTIQATFAVSASYAGATVDNTATVSSSTADPNAANDSSTASANSTPQADLAISKSGPGSLIAGTNAVYTIVVTNNGPSDAANVSVTDLTPAGLTFVSNSGDCVTAFPCNLGTIPAGQTRTIQATFSVPSGYSGATVDNTAAVLSPTTDPNPANNTSTATSPSGTQADLAIAKSGPASVVAGTNVVYTIVVTNSGPSDAANVTVADPAPAGLSFVSNAGDCATAFPCSLGSIPAGQARTIQATFAVLASYSGATVDNIATVSSTTSDPNITNNTSTVNTPVAAQADLAIAKSGPATVSPGSNVVYTIVVTNNGPSDAANVSVADLTPAGLTFVSNSGDCATAFPCSLGSIPSGQARTIQATFSVPLGYSGATVDNTATVSSTTSDPNPANDTGATSASVGLQADLTIVKSGPTTLVAGTNAVYTIVVTNNGPSDAANVSVADPAPAGLTFVSNSGDCSTAFPCSLGSIPAGQTRTIQATFSIPSGYSATTVDNTATVSSPTADPDTANNTSTSSAPVGQQADLAIAKSGPPSVVAGTNAVYTIVVTNNGPSDAANVSVADLTPAGLTFVSNSGDCATTFPCSLGSIPAGQTRTIQATFSIPSGYSGTTVANTATVSSPTADPDTANNTSTTSAPAGQQADLGIAKTGPASLIAGTNAIYTIVVTNNGLSDAANVSVADPTPAGLTFVSNSGDCATAFPCSLGSIPAGQTRTIQATFAVPTSYAGASVDNTATVTSTTADPNAANDSSTANTTVTTQADLAISKTGPASLVAGTNAVYTIVVTNNGPSDAANVSVADLTPAGLTFVSNSGDCTAAFPCSLGSIPAGQTRTIQTTFAVPASYSGATVDNTATVSSTTADPNSANNTSTATSPSGAQADLAIAKSGPAGLAPGTNAVYTIVVTNNGPSDATNVTVADPTPAGLAFVSNTGDCATAFPCNLGTIPASQTRTIQATFSVPSGYSAATVDNTATVSSPTSDPSAVNNSSTTSAVVGQQADMFITKTDGAAAAVPGAAISYTIVVGNNGPSDVIDASINDTVPAAVTGVSWTCTSTGTATCATPSGSGNAIAFTVSIPAGAGNSVTIVVNGTIDPAARGTLQNTATATAPLGVTDPTPGDNSASDSDALVPTADLSIVKSATPDPVAANGNLSYTLQVSNAGPSVATGVVINDALPAGTTFQSVSATGWTCVTPAVGSNGPVSCTLDTDLAVGAAPPIVIVVAAPSTGGSVLNSASVAADATITDPDPSNDSASAAVTVTPIADLSATKTLDILNPSVGDTITYVVTVRNSGPSEATTVVVTDQLPAGLTLIDATPSQGTYTAASGAWAVGTLANGAAATLTVRATVTTAGVLTNTATASAAESDPNTGNNTASISTGAQQADLSLTKTVDSATPNVGQNVTFRLTLANAGPNLATGIQVTDQLPAGLVFVSATPSQGTYTAATGIWVVGTLASGGSATLDIVATATSSSPVTNIAEVSDSDQVDPDSLPGNLAFAEDDLGQVVVTAQSADLSIDKTLDVPAPNIGDTITYVVTVRNNGPSEATTVVVTDQLPAGLTLIDATPSQGTYTAASGAWAVGTLANGAAATLTIRATVTTASAVTNTASIAGADQPDSNPGNDQDSVSTLQGQADLALTKTVSTPTPNIGQNVTFRVTVANAGPNTATNTEVTDALPAGLAFVSATASQGTYAAATGLWSVGALASGASATLDIVATVTTGALVTNVARVSDLDQFDGNAANDSAQAAVAGQSADLSLLKTVDTPNPSVGDTITYSVVVRNDGPSAATNVGVSDQLPAGLAFVSATASQGTYSAATGLWSVGTLANGASATLQIRASVTTAAPITNLASISGSDQPDPDASDNQYDVTVPSGTADLTLTKTANTATPAGGQNVVFNVVLRNNGPNAATGVIVTDQMPAGLRLESVTPSQGTYSPATGIWDVGTLANGASASLQVLAIIEGGGMITNVAAVTASDQFDPDSIPNNQVVGEDDQASASVLSPTAVTLVSFTANPGPGGPVVRWETSMEINTSGFHLYRGTTSQRADAVRVTPALILGQGRGTSGASYRWVDTNASPGVSYVYWLQEIEIDGVTVQEYGPVFLNGTAGAEYHVYVPLVVSVAGAETQP